MKHRPLPLNCDSEFVRLHPVVDLWGSDVAWEGEVCEYRLDGHPEADRAFAWDRFDDDGNVVDTVVVLAVGSIQTARDAVRAAIAAEHRKENPGS